MNKTALKNFATAARRELIQKVQAKAMKIGITEDKIKRAEIESSDAIYIDGKQLSVTEKKQREKLISRINETSYKQVVEEVAYTWFNRFTALRFMEVNNYLPTRVRVLSSSNPESQEPDIIKEALSVDLDIDKERVYELKLNNETEKLYKYLIIKQCNSLHKVLPFMFEEIEDYTEILFPEGLLAKDSFLCQMTDTEQIPESNWQAVEIIGWLYQYYIAEKKDRVFADLKKNIKITKENIPAATQLFTPNWIVRYMVENSLGRIWLESYPQSSLKSDWKYYLDEAEQEEEVKKQLEEIRYKDVNPEEITFLDPCCGSGHILVYAFDVFYSMYLEKGYVPQEIPKLILEKNLYGLDIDDRAAQLAAFSVMMKAREKSRRVFNQNIKLNITSIQETNWMTEEHINVLVDITASADEQVRHREALENIRDTFQDAKEYGSLLEVGPLDPSIINSLSEHSSVSVEEGDIIERLMRAEVMEKIPSILLQTRILIRKFDVVCTNPPYMGRGGMNSKLSKFVKNQFEEEKSDLYSVFIKKCINLCLDNGRVSVVTMESWLFDKSFTQLRKQIVFNHSIETLLHMDNGVMIGFGTVATIIRKGINVNYIGKYYYTKESLDSTFTIELRRFFERTSYTQFTYLFRSSPDYKIIYNISSEMAETFDESQSLDKYAEGKEGLNTGDNERFLRYWHEVEIHKIGFDYIELKQTESGTHKWFPIQKGGSFRRWYGNNEYVVNWLFNGADLKKFKKSNLRNTQFYFNQGLTWTRATVSGFGVRYCPKGYIFDSTGPLLVVFNENNIFWLLALLNSKVIQKIIRLLCKRDYRFGSISKIPVKEMNQEIVKRLEDLALDNIKLSKEDWDRHETSWDFKYHPLFVHKFGTVKESFYKLMHIIEDNFYQMKNNEEEINSTLIKIYALENELTPDVDENYVTLLRTGQEREIKSFISYAIGCMFGRYSLDEDGLIFAGGQLDHNRYKTFKVDKDNILPILTDAYLDDDIVSRFVEFVEVTFSKETLEENLNFIAEALGRRNNETSRETIRRYILNDFYKDHVQTYKKRPIYWLFTSGRQKAFNCLIYMHRYDKTTLSRIRTDYVHPLQMRMDAERETLLSIIEGDSTTREKNQARRQLTDLDKKIEELQEYEQLLHHMADMQIEIDLDDGVKVNYKKFEGLLANIGL